MKHFCNEIIGDLDTLKLTFFSFTYRPKNDVDLNRALTVLMKSNFEVRLFALKLNRFAKANYNAEF